MLESAIVVRLNPLYTALRIKWTNFVMVQTIFVIIWCKILWVWCLNGYLSLPSGYHKPFPSCVCVRVRVNVETVSPVPIINEPANLCYMSVKWIFFFFNAVSPWLEIPFCQFNRKCSTTSTRRRKKKRIKGMCRLPHTYMPARHQYALQRLFKILKYEHGTIQTNQMININPLFP